jgi:hypothetical protein
MNSFPQTFEAKPQERQFAKEVAEYLGCKDPMTVNFILAVFTGIRVFDWKQQRYGVKNIARGGDRGVVTRLGDKVSRLENLLAKEENPVDESIEDTFGDAGVYGFIGLLWRWGIWPRLEAPAQEAAK